MDEQLVKRAENLLRRARVQLLLRQPFFGELSTYLELKPAQLPPVSGGMGTDGKHLYFQPDKIAEIPSEQLEGVVAHEVLHIALGHPWRREHRDPFRWNVATDFAVNSVVRNHFQLPPGTLYRAEYEGKCAEEIYNSLPKPACPECGCGCIRGVRFESTELGGGTYRVRARFRCEGCGHEWTEEFTGTPEEMGGLPMPFDEVEGEFPTALDDHSHWDENRGEKAERLAQQWKSRMIRAAQAAKAQGRLPGDLERFVDELLYPKLSWREILWRYTSTLRGGRLNWRRPNKRWLRYGIYYPTRRERRLDVAVAVDTSGSISEEELREFLSELRGILASFRSFRVRMFGCDSAIHTDVTATTMEDFERFRVRLKGAGGTDYCPVFKALEEDNVQALVYLGDMWATFPEEEPGYDVIWVVSKEGDPDRPPFGTVIQLG